MNDVCKICGCTDDHACMTESGPCHWVLGNLCSACVIELSPEEHRQGNYGLLIEKQCQNCAHLIKEQIVGNEYFTCEKNRFDTDLNVSLGDYHWYARSGISRPNKAVARAQRKCPFFEVHPRWRSARVE